MASYIGWYGKKRAALARFERELVGMLQKDANATTLAEQAERVRAAQVRALRSKRAQLPPAERNAAAVANLDWEIAYWLGLPLDVIIDGFRCVCRMVR